MEENKVQNKKRPGRLNILDVVIIITLVMLIAVAVVLSVPRLQNLFTTDDTVQITYTVVFENVDESVYDRIMLDQTVIDAQSGRVLGSVALTPELVSNYEFVLETDADGNSIAQKHTHDALGKSLTVTIRAEAEYSEGRGYVVDGYRIAIGADMDLRFPGFAGAGYCSGIALVG